MNRGMIGFPFGTGKNIVQQVVASGGTAIVLGTNQGNGSMKSSIIVFDSRAGTRTWVCPAGVNSIRAFVVGAAGGAYTIAGSGGGYSEQVISVTPGASYSYTVGLRGTSGLTPTAGGTSSFASLISATGGAASGGSPGSGSGGGINTSGGTGTTGGGASGHRFGNGGNGGIGGGGWLQDGAVNGGNAVVDGFGIGLVPAIGGDAASVTLSGSNYFVCASNGGYGSGGGGIETPVNTSSGNAGNGGSGGGGGGIGGTGAGIPGNGGIGAGAGVYSSGSLSGIAGAGLVGIEVLG